MWEEDTVVKKCRWILEKRKALADKCMLLSLTESAPEYVLRPYQKAILEREWDTHECTKFSYALPNCLNE